MQYALPIISTPEGGIRDIIDSDKNGFILKQKDSKALADKLELLINNPELQLEMGAEGFKKYEQEFTVEMYGKRLDTIFKKALSK
jgi:glycosyltransferase involved in cell wall biosynthesis